jgi:hypothetical protein
MDTQGRLRLLAGGSLRRDPVERRPLGGGPIAVPHEFETAQTTVIYKEDDVRGWPVGRREDPPLDRRQPIRRGHGRDRNIGRNSELDGRAATVATRNHHRVGDLSTQLLNARKVERQKQPKNALLRCTQWPRRADLHPLTLAYAPERFVLGARPKGRPSGNQRVGEVRSGAVDCRRPKR